MEKRARNGGPSTRDGQRGDWQALPGLFREALDSDFQRCLTLCCCLWFMEADRYAGRHWGGRSREKAPFSGTFRRGECSCVQKLVCSMVPVVVLVLNYM